MSDTLAFEGSLANFFPGPDEWLGPGVIFCDERIDMLLQLLDSRERCAAERLALQNGEPYLDLIEPRRSCRREVEVHFGVLLEPTLILLVGVEVVDDDVKLAIRKGGNDAVHEAEELHATAPFRMRGYNLAGSDLECCKQGRRSVPLVIVALSGQGAAVRQLQITLRSLQCLDRRLFVDAKDNGLRGWIDIQADNVGGLGCKLGIVALAPGFAGRQVDLVVSQEPPDILNANIAQRLGQKRSRPSRKSFRRRLVQQRKNPLVGRFRIDRLLARSRLVAETFKSMIGKAIPPETGNPGLYADFLGDRARAASGCSQQHNPGTLQVTLQRARRSATSFQRLAVFPRNPHFSCVRNHPDVESRLTFLEKRVLATLREEWLSLGAGTLENWLR